MALGSYDVTPMEMAGAYTIFANQGVYVKPSFVTMVRTQDGKAIYNNKNGRAPVLDPRVAYLMTNLMEEVMRSGTAAGVRARGFTVPAAGKTGTSHDGWFAGYTSELLCIVWVGFDDNRELDLEGAHSALPIWTEFMKRALQYRAYRNARPFEAPDGIVSAQIDPESGMLATPYCPTTISEVYISGHAAGNGVPAARERAERDACGRLGDPRQCVRRPGRHPACAAGWHAAFGAGGAAAAAGSGGCAAASGRDRPEGRKTQGKEKFLATAAGCV